MDHLNPWFDIFSLLDLKSQLALLFTCNLFKNNLSITDLYDIEEKYLNVLTNNILRLDIFKYVTKLKANNKKITNVSFMTNLKILYASCYPGINQNGINGLDLVELNASYNDKVINVSFMKNLKKLNVSENRGIDQNGINGLDLVELHVNFTNKINNVSFMKNLKKLYAYCNCRINQNGIKGLDLVELDTYSNTKITDISFMKNLKIYKKIIEFLKS